jgi:hypothetical protein
MSAYFSGARAGVNFGWDLFFALQGRVRAGAYWVFTNPGDLH